MRRAGELDWELEREMEIKRKGQVEKDGQNMDGRLVNWEFHARRSNEKLIAKGCESPACTEERDCSLRCRESWGKGPWGFTVVTLKPF